MKLFEERMNQMIWHGEGSAKSKDLIMDPREETSHKFKVVPSNFDGKVSWSTYHKQFEDAGTANGWSNKQKTTSLIVSLRGEALEILQTVSDHLQENYELSISRLKMRYGDALFQQVYQAQIKSQVQKAAESLKTPDTFLDQLAIQIFVDGLRDNETQQTLRLPRLKTLDDALVHALEFEAEKHASQRDGQRLCCAAEVPAQTLESIEEIARRILREKGATTLNCGEIGHVRRHRTKPKKKSRRTLENLERGDQKRHKVISSSQAPEITIRMASRREQLHSIYLDGKINGKSV
ncbi:hypothetical protein RN001_004351 [Aquatica leii]|uniref:Uncharacterized protein n=1 Tax=Aquatica leii TaxID=1421715 RepID=A0AAN7PZU6_9COLE|nr:hypothetical protein RN001_004351 [Aquatica leii]